MIHGHDDMVRFYAYLDVLEWIIESDKLQYWEDEYVYNFLLKKKKELDNRENQKMMEVPF